MLRTENLSKKFGELVAVDGVDYQLADGETASIIGPNGAGKTTFFNLLSGEYAPTSGRVYLRDEDVTDVPPHGRVQAGMGRVFQISNLFPELTTFEHVRLSVASARVSGVRGLLSDAYGDEETLRRVDEVLVDLGLDAQREVRASALSHGDKRLLEVGMALARDPDVVLMDEPTSGLPDEEVSEFISFVRDITDDYTLLIVEHKMDVVMELSDRISVLHNGQLLAEGTVDEIRTDPQVRDVYLGREGQRA